MICEEFRTNDNECKNNDKMNVLNKIMLCLAVGWVQELAIPIVPRVLKHGAIHISQNSFILSCSKFANCIETTCSILSITLLGSFSPLVVIESRKSSWVM